MVQNSMGTAMAVNFANLFMSQLEYDMLGKYKQLTGKQPLLWLRLIDDIFFIWTFDKTSLKHFINFCDNYSTNHNLASTIPTLYVQLLNNSSQLP